MPILVDSSVFIAAARPRETHHRAAAEALAAHSSQGLVTPVTILAETMSFIRARFGIEQQRRFWDGFANSGIEVVPVDAELIAAARDIDARYGDAGLGFADCTLLAACEQAGATTILSLDQRLRIYRLTSGKSLELLP